MALSTALLPHLLGTKTEMLYLGVIDLFSEKSVGHTVHYPFVNCQGRSLKLSNLLKIFINCRYLYLYPFGITDNH